MKQWLFCLLCLCITTVGKAQFSESTLVRQKVEVDINTTQQNNTARSYKKLLFLGTGSYFSRNTWEHICMALQERLKPYNITATYVYLSSDSMAARRTYDALVKTPDFDAILWFACAGNADLKEVYKTVYSPRPWGGYDYRYQTNIDGTLSKDIVSEQRWNLRLYTVAPQELVWAADMHTKVVELKEKSYRKVATLLMDKLGENLIIPFTPKKVKDEKKDDVYGG